MSGPKSPEKILEALHGVMKQGYREKSHLALCHYCMMLLIGGLPALFLLVALNIIPIPAIPPVPDTQSIAQKSISDAALTTLNTPPSLTELSPAKLAELSAQLEQLAKAVRTPPAAIEHSALWRSSAAFVGAAALASVFAIAVTLSQFSIIRRHWNSLLSDAGRPVMYLTRPTDWLLPAFLVSTIGFFLFADRLPTYLGIAEANASPGMPLLILLWLLFTSVFLAIFVTAVGTFLYAKNFPDVRKIGTVANDIKKLDSNLDDAISTLVKTSQSLPRMPSILVDTDLSATASLTVIRAMIRIVAIMAILALTSIWLGLDALTNHFVADNFPKDAVQARHNGLLLLAGVGMSLSLAAIYFPPLSHIGPYIPADSEAKPEGWEIRLADGLKQFEFHNPSLKIRQTDTKKYDDFSLKAQYYIGADRKKLKGIVEAAKKGGGFHGAVDGDVTGYLKTALTLLAPVGTSTILAFLG